MYRLKTADATLYADAIRYIRVHENGCYVACHQTKAEGICAKVHVDETVEVETAEGEIITETVATLRDTVFAITEGALHGTEPVCISIEGVAANELLEGQHAQEALNIILGGEVV